MDDNKKTPYKYIKYPYCIVTSLKHYYLLYIDIGIYLYKVLLLQLS